MQVSFFGRAETVGMSGTFKIAAEEGRVGIY